MADQNPNKSKQRLDWELLAKDYGISGYEKLENKKLFKALQDKTPAGKSITDEVVRVKAKSGNTSSSSASKVEDTKAVEEVKAEVISPLTKYEHAVQVHAPQIHNHIQPPKFDLMRTEAPRWHEVVNNVWTIGLHMVLGAALYAVLTHAGAVNIAMLAH